MLKKRTIKSFSEDVQKAASFMSIHGKSRLIGSASLDSLKYYSDFGLEEEYKTKDTDHILQKIYERFIQIFKVAEENKTIWITDFKCGLDSNGEPLRWNKFDIKKGFKKLKDKRKRYFVDCILDKTTMKLDMVALFV